MSARRAAPSPATAQALAPAPAPASQPTLQPQFNVPPVTVPPPIIITPPEPTWKTLTAPAVALLSALINVGSVVFAWKTYRLSLARDISALLGQRSETQRALALQAFGHRVARPIGATLDTLEALLKDVRGLASAASPARLAAGLLGFSVRAQLDLVTCQHRCRDADQTIAAAGRAAVFADALAADYPLDAFIEAAQAALGGAGQAAVLNAYDRLVTICTTLQSTLRRLLEQERNAEARRSTLRLDALPVYGELRRYYPAITAAD